MATITVNQYNDDGTTTRTAGETLTINSGTFTQRTDSRWHATAPASMTGALAGITINEGEYYIDARDVRWLAYDNGTSTVPAIGTSIVQGDVSGYLLGVWLDLLSAPTAVGASMPATGFIKLRETSGGLFSAGALTNIGASATGADVTGWIEVVYDQSATISVPRLGKYTSRGDYFYLDNTSGDRAQILQTPVNGGGANTFAPGVEIETAPNSGVYEKYPALYTATNGWSVAHLGQPMGESDARQKFVKMLTNGQMQIGEQITQSGTYAYTASQASTYASLTRGGTYTWVDDLVTIFCSGGHFLEDGMQTGIDFTSGTATDGIYTVSVLDPYYFTVVLNGSGANGTCNSREGVAVTFTAHGLNIGEHVYLTPSTGTLPSGEREIYAATTANIYWVKYPHTTVLTSGNTGALHTVTVTSNAHGLAVGNRVYIDFTSGTAPDGIYTIKAVAANTYTINCPLSATTSGNFTSYHDIGFVPVSKCKTRIPNIIGRQCVTTTRATNAAPHATIANRPEFATTSAGYIDTEYIYSDWYYNLSQPYYVKIKNSWLLDTLIISECALPMDIINNGFGMQGALDLITVTLTSNFAGGTFNYNTIGRGNTPGTTDHTVSVSYCNNINFTGNVMSIIQFVRSTGFPINTAYCSGLHFYNNEILNGNIKVIACSNFEFHDTDYCDRMIGYTNATTPYYIFNIDTASSNFIIDGATLGKNGTVINNHPYSGLFSISGGCNNFKVRNFGTPSNLLVCGSSFPNLYGIATPIVLGGNDYNYKIQKVYVDRVRTSLISTSNSEKTATYESIHCKSQYQIGTYAVSIPAFASLNTEIKGVGMYNETTGNASVYGQHWRNIFGIGVGRLLLSMNEASTETASQISVMSGTAKFNSSGGVILPTIGNEVVWETPHWILGNTGFNPREEIVMSGGTNTNYNIMYSLNAGSSYGDWKNLSYCPSLTSSGSNGAYTVTLTSTAGVALNDYVYGTNIGILAKVSEITSDTVLTLNVANTGTVSGVLRFNSIANESINASGFKLKIKITTIVTNTTAITFLRLNTLTSWSAQTANVYPLDVYHVTLTGLKSGSEVRFYLGDNPSTTVELDGIESSGTSFTLEHSLSSGSGYIQIFALGYQPIKLDITYAPSDTSIQIQQVVDRVYVNN
jgi:hypothetical protein